MISKKMEKALNTQINKELYSAYIYLSMATYLAEKRFDGMAGFMKVQAQLMYASSTLCTEPGRGVPMRQMYS